MSQITSESYEDLRRKAAKAFLSNIPVDFKSFCEACRERRPRTTHASKSLQSLEEPSCAATEPTLKEADVWETDVFTSESTQIKVTWAERTKFPKSSYKMSLLKPRVVLQKRIFIVDKSGDIPVSVVSVLGYKKEGKLLTASGTNISIRRRSKLASGSQASGKILEIPSDSVLRIDGIQVPVEEEEISYKSLLDGSSEVNFQLQSLSELENPEWKCGSHRTVLTFPSYIVSVMDYAKPTDLKKDLNDRFKEKYPKVNITLSKCRSLKQAIQRIAASQNTDQTAVARALLYFNYLVMSGKVVKVNRRHCAGVCLLLSAKVNSDLKTPEISKLISAIEHGLKVGRQDLVLFEFPVLAALQFSLISFPSSH